MIRSFADKETTRVWNGEHSRKLATDMQQTARRKLRALNRAKVIGDLAAARGNRLEQLKGDRKGTYSLRINDQWRITFHWIEGDAHDVRIEDYHS
jgi:proteic killer suppression protein